MSRAEVAHSSRLAPAPKLLALPAIPELDHRGNIHKPFGQSHLKDAAVYSLRSKPTHSLESQLFVNEIARALVPVLVFVLTANDSLQRNHAKNLTPADSLPHLGPLCFVVWRIYVRTSTVV